MILISIFRIFALFLASYFWWLGIGEDLYILSSSGEIKNWGGGLRYLTNWVLTLNLIIAINAIILEFNKKFSLLNFIYIPTLSMNLVIIVLYWGMRSVDKTLLDIDNSDWSIFQIAWDYYLHWGMSIIVFTEAIFFSNKTSKLKIEYITLMSVFLGYIFWIEIFISKFNQYPCGKISCGFPYPFLNEYSNKERIIFYLIVWFIGTSSFIISKTIYSFINRKKRKTVIFKNY